ncbi:hypothetical protein HYZ99_03795 [Candidatus Peregrinibacteria bacterium]|nr:hypothetical protein [Candidatus Peregrinibacteria bacterium]
MAQDPQALATKADIKMLMDALAKMYQEIEGWDVKMDEKIKSSEDRQHQNFMILFEDLRHDMIGTHKDKIQDHEDRIVKLERKTGLATAA